MAALDPTRPEYTRALATWAHEVRCDALPAEVVRAARSVVLDYLGVALVGSTRAHARAAAEAFGSFGGRPACSVIGLGERTSSLHAAFLNGLFGSSSPQLDDVWKESLGHPGVGTLPAVLAAAEHGDATGGDVIEAVVVGYELAMRVGAAVGREGLDNGWHPRGGVNVFAAAAGAGKILGLGVDGLVTALSLAGNTAGGLTGAVHFFDAWYLLSAHASMNGLLAATLADRGLTSGPRILEATYGGYLEAVVAAPHWERLTDGLGRDHRILEVGQKLHASSAATHAAIDATLALVTDHDLHADEIERIVVRGFRSMVGRLGRPYPETAVHAGMSVPYLVATAALRRRVGLEQVVEGDWGAPDVVALQGRVELRLDERLESLCPGTLGAAVEITTTDGRRLGREVLHARGDPRNPLTEAEVEEKFHTLADRVLAPATVDRVVELVRGLDRQESIRPLLALVSGPFADR